MKFGQCLNATIQEVLRRKYNIFVGISLGNKYFSESHIEEYIMWAARNTKDSLSVLIPDKIHAITYEVRNEYNSDKALRLAIETGSKIHALVEKIIHRLPHTLSVEILTWQDIENDDHLSMVRVLQQEFKKNILFKEAVLEVVRENFTKEDYSLSKCEQLAQYILHELPILIGGVTSPAGKYYNLIPYPGISKIDYLALTIQNGNGFPSLTKKLSIKNTCILLELYVDNEKTEQIPHSFHQEVR